MCESPLYLLNDKTKAEENTKEGEADEGKEAEEGKGFALVVGGVGAEGNKAG